MSKSVLNSTNCIIKLPEERFDENKIYVTTFSTPLLLPLTTIAPCNSHEKWAVGNFDRQAWIQSSHFFFILVTLMLRNKIVNVHFVIESFSWRKTLLEIVEDFRSVSIPTARRPPPVILSLFLFVFIRREAVFWMIAGRPFR